MKRIAIILSILGALYYLLPQLIIVCTFRKTDTARIGVQVLAKALQSYRLNCGFYPKNEAGLKALITNVSQCPNWQGPHVKETMFIDPWGNSIAYEFDGNSVLLTSFAKDGKPGGEEDGQDISVRVDGSSVEVVGEQ